ncbi:MAG TPA: hypothetical protein VNY05_32815 [Candidatus Acidoferrales bacterium]|jgi:hypothetical protein|nr:hypothetical protein [Candidatus Acidoferrales bacterium]
MTLADLRKFSIRKQFRVRFPLQNGMECVIDEHGVAHVPALKSVPDFNLEKELVSARQFVLEPVSSLGVNPAGVKNAPKPRSITRDELETLAMAAPVGAAAHDAHDDE